MPDNILLDAEERMEKAIEVLSNDFATIRTGRANARVLDNIVVEYYGVPTPINQTSVIQTPDARTLTIKPYDKSTLKAIERALLESDLGITPQNDGQIIRLSFPQLTEDRRKELARSASKYGEQAKIAVRNIRRDANDSLKKLEKDSSITEDQLKSYTDDVQTLTDKFIKQIDELVAEKETEITTI